MGMEPPMFTSLVILPSQCSAAFPAQTSAICPVYTAKNTPSPSPRL